MLVLRPSFAVMTAADGDERHGRQIEAADRNDWPFPDGQAVIERHDLPNAHRCDQERVEVLAALRAKNLVTLGVEPGAYERAGQEGHEAADIAISIHVEPLVGFQISSSLS